MQNRLLKEYSINLNTTCIGQACTQDPKNGNYYEKGYFCLDSG